jgi:hypothetical protein
MSTPNGTAIVKHLVNHVAFILDGSGSMGGLRNELIKMVDAEIAYQAQRSKELGQETRITVYVFGDETQCIIHDCDVLRLPSIGEHYQIRGMTALIDATLQGLDDLAHIWEGYCDHAFLIYVLTDGMENRSHKSSLALVNRLEGLPENWTVAALVPDQRAVFEAKRFGFPGQNVSVWDATSARGVQEAVGVTMRQATEGFMTGRASGIRSSKNLFATGAEAVNDATIRAAGLAPLAQNAYFLIPVPEDAPIREFVQNCGHTYRIGRAFYQLSKTETIQGQKAVAVLKKKTNEVFTGPGARDLIGLGHENRRAKPDFNPEYEIFVQSTSVNRKLITGTRLLLLL